MMPKNIRAARFFNKVLGACFLILAIVPGLPVGFAIYHDGVSSVFDWPPLFNWLSAFIALSVSVGTYLIVAPQRAGVDVCFRPSGFTLRIRPYFRKQQVHHVTWADIKEIEVVEAPRNSDGMSFRLANGASVSFPISLVETGVEETFARFRTSAELSGHHLERQGGFNALIIQKQTWRVVPNP